MPKRIWHDIYAKVFGLACTHMSKNKKKPLPNPPKSVVRPEVPAATPTSAKPVEKFASSTLPVTAKPESPDQLIRFDRKLKWFLGVSTGLFLLFTLARFHLISIPIWNTILPDGSDARRGLISGQPRPIRMDDYAVGTPWLMAQAYRNFPMVNENIGDKMSAALVAPSRHINELFKPDHYGYFLFDLETGYSWMYNFRIYYALVGAMLLFMLLTGNNFWLSFVGSVWLGFSTGTASWAFIPSPIIADVSFLFASMIYTLYSRKPVAILLWGLSSAYWLLAFILVLYPPYQVMFGYLLAVLFIGYIINHYKPDLLLDKWPLKALATVVALAVTGLVMYDFYTDMKPAIDAISNTVYPGKRSETGGTGFIANWFSEYFNWQVGDQKFPQKWLNYCELAHYITFTPIILPAMAYAFWQKQKIDWGLVLMAALVVAELLWITVGFPEWLAKATLWYVTPTRRAQIPFGITEVVFAVLFLSYVVRNPLPVKPVYTFIGAAAILAYMIYAGVVNVKDSDEFFRLGNLFVPIVFFTLLGSLMLPTWQPQWRDIWFGAGILLFLIPNYRLNPVSKGLSPISDNALYKAIQDIRKQEPNGKWVVFGSQYLTYLLTATGVDCLTGVKYTPPRSIYRALDPKDTRDSAYNRYAHTTYASFINGTDSVFIRNTYEDACLVALDPCSPKMKALNVRFYIFDKQPQPVEVRCMKLVQQLGSIQIYRRND